MARFTEPTPEQEAAYKEWVADRPDAVREVAERFDPWTLYRLKTSGSRVTVRSFCVEESGKVSLTINVSGEFNLLAFERSVFGIDPNDLEPCELPQPGEDTGAVFDELGIPPEDQIEMARDFMRAMRSQNP